eukprot:m.159155 g.159155  ORF g.159155 m.159155 type:complete len:177 (+) comp17994_c0_seq1:135-665(+)
MQKSYYNNRVITLCVLLLFRGACCHTSSPENMIYTGMDDAEFEHVEKVTREKYEREIARYKREGEDIKEFRAKQRKTEPDEVAERGAHPAVKLVVARQKKKVDALSSLAGAIKRKPSTSITSGGSISSANSVTQAPCSVGNTKSMSDTKTSTTAVGKGGGQGLVAYGDSDTDTDSD